MARPARRRPIAGESPRPVASPPTITETWHFFPRQGPPSWPASNPVEAKPKFFTAEEANKALPLVKAIVGDIARQFQVVNELRERLGPVAKERRRPSNDAYTEESAQSRAELESEEASLATYVEELNKLGVELKGPDGLCDFPSLREGREVCLCWRFGEPAVAHWHEKNAGFAGRQPLDRPPTRPSAGASPPDRGSPGHRNSQTPSAKVRAGDPGIRGLPRC